VGIDVLLQPRSSVEVCLYDGQTLPFGDGTFDCVMIVDVLHHTQNVKKVMHEARRVCRRYILVKDHYWERRLDQACLRVADYLGNAAYGISAPHRYLRLEEWMALFLRHARIVADRDTWRYHWLDPCRNIVARLRKTGPSTVGPHN
jgi:ubiquinone/menaquinone biosynthesis C-methylase UbiE